MLEDIVVDTNVLMHAQNPNEVRFASTVDFLQALLSAETRLALDDGFDLDPARNASHIGHEYLANLLPGSLGYTVVAELGQKQRLSTVARMPPRPVAKVVRMLVRKPSDRVFLAVAYNTVNCVLVSHDFTDFQSTKRAEIYDQIGVRVVEASVALPMLSARSVD